MKLFYTIIKLVILAILLVFALINTAKVQFFYLPSEFVELPLWRARCLACLRCLVA